MNNPQIIHCHLNNGMEVYLNSTNFAPIVSLQVLVKVGSVDEEEREGGAAHVLEHMLFKGTKKFPGLGQIASTVEFEGGDINAYTTFDHTNYHLTAPSLFVRKGTELLLDVVQNSLLDSAELKKELEVVIEEIRRGRDNPNSVVSHNLFSLFYQNTPLARPVIGHQNVVEQFDRETIFNFYKKWYAPNNMIFIAAGDFNPTELLNYLKEWAVHFPQQELPARNHAQWPTPAILADQPTNMVKVESGPWQESRVQLATPAPSLEDAQMPAWDVLSSILGESDSSRLVRVLRDELQLVTSIDCSCFSPKNPTGMFGIGFFGMAANAPEALQIIVREIKRLSEVPPTQAELLRILNTLKAQRIYARESMDGIARNAGLSLQTSKKLQFEDFYMECVRQVTPSEVQSVAKKVLEHILQGQFAISAAIGEHLEIPFTQDGVIQSIVEAAKLNHTQQSDINPDVKQICVSLPHGKTLKINFRHSKRLPVMCGVLVLKGGLVLEAKEKNGVAALCASMLTRGTTKHNYRKFIEELEDRASSISAFSARDIFGLRFDTMSEHGLRTIELLLDSLFRPEFSSLEWERAHKETLETIIAQKDSPSAHLARISQSLLYHDHPYARTSLGCEETVSTLQKSDAQEYWQQLFLADEYVFSVAGDFDILPVVDLLETEFKAFFADFVPFAPKPHIGAPAPVKVTDKRVGFSELNREQVHIIYAFRALTLDDSRRTALEIAAQILAGQGGRLFLDLRDSKSLAYSIGASQTPSLLAGVFSTYIATAPHKVKEVLEGMHAHIQELARTPPSEYELKRAQQAMLGAQSIDSQHYSYQASQLAMSDVYGLGFDNFLKLSTRVNKVTPEMVSLVLSSLLSENPPIITLVGPSGTWIPSDDCPLLKWNKIVHA